MDSIFRSVAGALQRGGPQGVIGMGIRGVMVVMAVVCSMVVVCPMAVVMGNR